MGTPSAYAKLREKQRQEAFEAEERNKAHTERVKEEDRALFGLLEKAFKEYHNQNLDGHKITIKATSKNELKFLVNGKHYLTFFIGKHWHPCTSIACEGAPCDHGWTDVRIDVKKQTGGKDISFRYNDYFCYEKNLNNPDEIAKEIAKLMDEYDDTVH